MPDTIPGDAHMGGEKEWPLPDLMKPMFKQKETDVTQSIIQFNCAAVT